MDPSSAQHHQDMANETLESMLVCTKSQQQEMKKPRPQQEQALRCPRCDSANTKFCYYNNYSLTQPRYFCKSCRRYWTKGGTLRNVPVGGGCRKTKRSSSKRSQDQQPMISNNQMINPLSNLPSLTYDTNDLSLAFARLQKQPNGVLGFHNHDHHEQLSILSNPNDTHFDLLGNPSGQILGGHRNGGFLDGFYNNNSHNNMFSGYGMGLENLGNNVSGGDQEMGGVPSFEDLNVNVKQEYCNIGGRDVSENRVLFGFPWQIGGGGADHGNIVGGGGYNGSSIGGSTNWHGLINSPLM